MRYSHFILPNPYSLLPTPYSLSYSLRRHFFISREYPIGLSNHCLSHNPTIIGSEVNTKS
ncbi:hypothetical protein [Moorena producens]|uniref:hypothetical protein n=1 Tax=Moorena producens TaxID=1155739 RepID=UPI003C70B961